MLSSHYSLWILGNLPVPLSLRSTVPFGRPSASFEKLTYSLILPHYHYCISIGHCPKHDTRRHSLSMLVLSYSDTLTTSMGIWDGAGATKVVTSLAAGGGIWHSAGATRSWFHSASWSKSFALIKKSLNSTEISYLEEKRNAQIWHSNTINRHKKIILMRKTMWCQEILNPCCTTVRFLSIFFNFSSTALNISLFLSSLVRRLNLAVLHSLFKIKEFLHKMAISFWDSNSKRTKSFFPCKMAWFAPPLWSFAQNLGYFVCSSAHSCLSSRVLLRPPSEVSSFSHFASLYSCCIALCCSPKHYSRRRSLLMRVSRKEWPVSQLTGVHGMLRVPRHFDCTHLVDRSLLHRSKKG